MVRNYPYIKNEELRDLIKRFCFANSIKIKHVYRMNKTQLYDIIEKYEIMEWILKKQKKNLKYKESSLVISEYYNIPKRHYKPDRSNIPNVLRDNIYVSDSNTFKYLRDLNCFDNIQYVHIKQLKDDDIIEFKYKNEYDENFKKISTIYMGLLLVLVSITKSITKPS